MATNQEKINKAVEIIVQVLLNEQYATTSDLAERVGDKDTCRRALTKLNRARAITKRVSESPDGSPVDEWTFQNPDRFRGKGPLAVLEEIFGKTEGTALVYGKYMTLETKIRLTTPSLSGQPGEDKNLVFRRLNGKIWLMPGYFQAMFREAARLTDGLSDRARSAAGKWTQFEAVFLDDDNVEHQTLIAPGGKGIFIGEALPVGTEIPVKMLFPATQLTAQQAMTILHKAGEAVGFSISKHKLGWGRFVVVE